MTRIKIIIISTFSCRMVAILVNVKMVGRDKIVIKMKMTVPQDHVQMELLALTSWVDSIANAFQDTMDPGAKITSTNVQVTRASMGNAKMVLMVSIAFVHPNIWVQHAVKITILVLLIHAKTEEHAVACQMASISIAIALKDSLVLIVKSISTIALAKYVPITRFAWTKSTDTNANVQKDSREKIVKSKWMNVRLLLAKTVPPASINW